MRRVLSEFDGPQSKLRRCFGEEIARETVQSCPEGREIARKAAAITIYSIELIETGPTFRERADGTMDVNVRFVARRGLM